MFESVAPGAFTKRNRRLPYVLLPLSIAVHAIGVGAALAAAIWTVDLPTNSPLLVSAYRIADTPPPPPPPPPPAAPQPKPKVTPPPQIAQEVAPTQIPDIIPKVPDLPPDPTPAPTDTGPGVEGGIPGGTGEVPPPPPPPEPKSPPPPPATDDHLYIPLGKDLPMETISQDYPPYPADAKKLQLEDQVIVRYTIGKDGRVNDVQILSHANFASFDTAVLEAIRKWRFRPLKKNGHYVEVTQDLGINFVLVRH